MHHLRLKERRPSGGQPGLTGKTLQMSEKIDGEIKHNPECCSFCGKSLPGTTDDGVPGRDCFVPRNDVGLAFCLQSAIH